MNERPYIIIGGGGHATVVLSLLRSINTEVIGFTNLETSQSLFQPNECKFLGDDSSILKYRTKDIFLALGIGSTKDNSVRKGIYEKFVKEGYEFPALIHRSVIIDTSCLISSGAQIMAGAVMQPHVKIGENSIVNTAASIDHHSIVGKHSHIAPGATLCGQVEIGDSSFVGAGATIINNIKVGKGVVIGAGCTVHHDIEDNSLALGSKMKVRRF